MKKVLVIFGYGPGISNSIAELFGRHGFTVALVARSEERLTAGVAALKAGNVEAFAFPGDVSEPTQVRRIIADIRHQLGGITVVQWSAYALHAANITTASEADLRRLFDIPVLGLVTAIQEALPLLTVSENPAILVTNGGLGLFHEGSDAAGVDWGVMGLSIANSAKHKLVRLLARHLKSSGIYVGEVMVLDTVKGTAFDNGTATLEPSKVAALFWDLYVNRTEVSVKVSATGA